MYYYLMRYVSARIDHEDRDVLVEAITTINGEDGEGNFVLHAAGDCTER